MVASALPRRRGKEKTFTFTFNNSAVFLTNCSLVNEVGPATTLMPLGEGSLFKDLLISTFMALIISPA